MGISSVGTAYDPQNLESLGVLDLPGDDDGVDDPTQGPVGQEKPAGAGLPKPSITANQALATKSLLDPSNYLAFAMPGEGDPQPMATLATNVSAATPAGLHLDPKQRSVLSLDLASKKLAQGDGAGAAKLLTAAAANARADAAKLNAASPEARFLNAFADNADARAKAYLEQAPFKSENAARDLYGVSAKTDRLAQELQAKGLTGDAKLLRAIAADSRVQAEVILQSAINTNALLGQGLSQTYQQVVNLSFDRKIADASNWKWPWQDASPHDKLVADKQKMQVVFAELNRTMREQGVSLDRAWTMMFDDNHIDGWRGAARVPGFPTRNDAAAFLRDNEVTRDLLSPFADMARGLSEGNAGTVDHAQAELVKSLRKNGQWEIARALLDTHLKDARTQEGRQEAQQLDASESREWWTAKAEDFVQKELPVLILSGLVSGGLGTGARALALTATWGVRAARGVQVAVEIASFVPTQRILNEAINGQKSDWSAGALARDYAFTIGGYALFRALGIGWQALRESGFGKNIVGRPWGANEVLEVVTPEGVRIRVARKELEDLVAKPLEARGASATGGVGGTVGRLTSEEQQALSRIAAFRELHNIPALDLTPKTGGETGTAAYVRIGNKEFHGLSTTLEREYLKIDTLALRKQVLSDIQTQLGKLKGASINGSGQFLTHAEAEALINAQRELGTLPKKLTLFVDRPTCNMCGGGADNGLPLLAKLYGIDELTVVDSLGNRLLIRPGQNTIKLK